MERSRQEEYLLLQWNASAVGMHHTKFARLCMFVYMWSQNVRRRDVFFYLAIFGWRVTRGKSAT